MKVLIRADASEWIGSGHVMRCLTLADEFKANLAKVHFVCRDFPGHLEDHIRKRGYHLTMLPKLNKVVTSVEEESIHASWLVASWQRDSDETICVIGSEQYDWLIVDHYGIDYRWHKKLRAFSKKILVIDDLADRKLDCDVLLDQTFGRQENIYKSLVTENCQMILGSKFALLRPEFNNLHHLALKKRENFDYIRNIMIFMGGMDPDNITGKMMEGLSIIKWFFNPTINVVMGGNAPHLAKVCEKAKEYPISINVYNDITNMAELMLEADLAIGAGGTTSWERCCMVLPTILLVESINQKEIGLQLQKVGAAKSIILDNNLEENLVKLVSELISSKKQMTTMIRNSLKICDGLGSKRLIEKIYNI